MIVTPPPTPPPFLNYETKISSRGDDGNIFSIQFTKLPTKQLLYYSETELSSC